MKCLIPFLFIPIHIYSYNLAPQYLHAETPKIGIIDLNDPMETLYARSMRTYFKETHEEITERLKPIVSDSFKKKKISTTMTYYSDDHMALQMSPFIIDSLDQEIMKQSAEIEKMALENAKSKRKLYISLLSGAAAVVGMITTIVTHYNKCP